MTLALLVLVAIGIAVVSIRNIRAERRRLREVRVWATTECPVIDRKTIAKLQLAGWEPFEVVGHGEGADVMWFRKRVTMADAVGITKEAKS